MPSGHDARRPVHGRAEEVARTLLSLARVDPHAHAQGPGLTPRLVSQRQLRLERALGCLGRRRENGHQPVAGDLDDPPVRPLHGRAEKLVVALDRDGHRVGQRLPQPRARLEIGEQECQRFGRRATDHTAVKLLQSNRAE